MTGQPQTFADFLASIVSSDVALAVLAAGGLGMAVALLVASVNVGLNQTKRVRKT